MMDSSVVSNIGNLEDSVSTLEALNKNNRNLAAKLAIAEETRAHEKSVQFLLNFELSQIRRQINESKRDIAELEKDQKRLISTNRNLNDQVRMIRNYFSFVNSLQVDRKEEHIQNLRGELSALDFTIEQKQDDPGSNNDIFTQLARN